MSKYRTSVILGLIVFSFDAQSHDYIVRLSDNDSFLVTVNVAKSLPNGTIFEFATTIPGVYDTTEYGDLVIQLNAYDANGGKLEVAKTSRSQWSISNPALLSYITYEIDDSYGSNRADISYIAGTSIEPDHILVNTIGLLGYFPDDLTSPASLSIDVPVDWIVASPLVGQGRTFQAQSFHELAEAPIMAGRLDVESRNISGIDIELYSFSSGGGVSAKQVLDIIEPGIAAATRFLDIRPVDRYVFLMQFLDRETREQNNIRGIGALEHATSSTYVLSENERILSILNEWVAHEYFHTVTPLRLHSNRIRPFRYSGENSDSHLWLYEGATVWASETLLLRDGQLTEQDYLDRLAARAESVGRRQSGMSLVELSRSIYSHASADVSTHIDNRGSLAVFCMDILLLEKSNGDSGFRDLLAELTEQYGREDAFDDAQLFHDIRRIGGEAVANFVDAHIVRDKPIQVAPILERLGYHFDAAGTAIIVDSNANEGQERLRQAWLGLK